MPASDTAKPPTRWPEHDIDRATDVAVAGRRRGRAQEDVNDKRVHDPSSLERVGPIRRRPARLKTERPRRAERPSRSTWGCGKGVRRETSPLTSCRRYIRGRQHWTARRRGWTPLGFGFFPPPGRDPFCGCLQSPYGLSNKTSGRGEGQGRERVSSILLSCARRPFMDRPPHGFRNKRSSHGAPNTADEAARLRPWLHGVSAGKGGPAAWARNKR
jgi:hypothetical protein